MTKPAISIIMAAHNEQEYLPLTLISLFEQTYDNFEIVCVDDGSTDDTPKILQRFARKHPNLKIVTNPKPLGLTPSLNKALNLAQGAYIARADADDLYDPTRLALQKSVLDNCPGIFVVGSQALQLNEEGFPQPELNENLPLKDIGLRWRMLFNSPFWHPSVMWRNQGSLRYDETCPVAQDYELWTRMSAYGKMLTIDKPLYHRRNHPGNISGKRRQEQIAIRDRLSREQITTLLGTKTPPPDVIDHWRSCFINQFKPYRKLSLWDLKEYFVLLASFCKSRKWNKSARKFWQDEVRKQIGYLWLCRQLYLIPALFCLSLQVRLNSRVG